MYKKRKLKNLINEKRRWSKKLKLAKTSQHDFGRKNDEFCCNIPQKKLKEADVGITQYVNAEVGFTGVLKARFSDFLVNEIDIHGNVVELTSQDVPQRRENVMAVEEIEKLKIDTKEILTDEIWQKIKAMIDESDGITVAFEVGDVDKSERTKIHKLLKYEFGNKIVTSTEESSGSKIIKCAQGKKGVRERSKWLWPGEFVWFVVYKENTDTLQAASDLARNLRLQPSHVFYAGTKDKRAKTCQLFCVKKREPAQIMEAAKRLKYMQIGNFEIKNVCLELGKLKGNRFKVVLRQINGDINHIEKLLRLMRSNGFINYYGLQRFGNNSEIPTYQVGLAILKEKYKEACELILKPREGDTPELKEMRDFWWVNRDSAKAAAMVKNNNFVEKKLLEGLALSGKNDYASALMRLPRNMLLLYTHAYQSFIWNQIASRRIEKFGTSLLEGDLVQLVQNDIDEKLRQSSFDGFPKETVNSDEDSSSGCAVQLKTTVRTACLEDISKNIFTIFDLVMPLPGFDVTYPSNVVGKWIEELLLADGLSSEKLKHRVKTFSLAGTYRKLLIKPEDLKWEFKNYNTPTCSLIESDYDKLQCIKAEPHLPDGKLKALILDFRLPSSSYATMALREILKYDTSSDSQYRLGEKEKKNELAGNQALDL